MAAFSAFIVLVLVTAKSSAARQAEQIHVSPPFSVIIS